MNPTRKDAIMKKFAGLFRVTLFCVVTFCAVTFAVAHRRTPR